ncbi:MAG: hypothetical protein K8R85_12375 [Bacteroidetes bacterium]|nr:hypothetical protein [Bacteroidota bacterium]
MKKKLLFLLITISQFSFAQIPQSFKYQAVVRDAAGVLSVNKIISIKTSVLAGSTTGSSVYTETQTLSTNEYGVVSLNIGAGTLVSGNFSTISWGATTYFVKTELDINGGSTYVFMGTSQILSVPYALYAEKTGSSLSDHDTSATNELQTLSISGKNLSISNGNTVVLPQDSLSISGYTLGITNGNTVNLPSPQTISIIGDSLHISNANSIYLSGSVDLDASPTNELQTLTRVNDTLKISMGNNVVFPHDNDRDSINEIQNLSILGKVISISKANSITLKDNDSLNEIQSLTLTQGSLKLSKANTVHLPDSSATNELQTLSVLKDTLITISNGNSVHINTSRSLKFPEGIDGNPIFFCSPTAINYTKFLYLKSCPHGMQFTIPGNPPNNFPSQQAIFDDVLIFPAGTVFNDFVTGYIQ